MAAEGFGRGKIILLGEHAVVHGRPALVAGLRRGARVAAERLPEGPSRLRVAGWNLQVQADPRAEHELGRALHALLAADPLGEALPPLRLEAEVELPGGAGLGLSAALGVAVVRAVDAAVGRRRPDAEVAAAVEPWERVFHGNPSGVDAAMAASGGLALYRRGEPLEPFEPARPLWLVVGHSGEPGRTAETVALVERLRAREPERVEGTFDAIASLVRNAQLALLGGELRSLGRLMDLDQVLLSSLMVSTARLEELCGAARAAGALGAKLTGGGGGGCMVALAEDEQGAERVLGALREVGAEPAFVAQVC